MGDVEAARAHWKWMIVVAALAATALPLVPGHFVWPRTTTWLVVLGAIVAHRGRPIVALLPVVTLTMYPTLALGFAAPLCCTYSGAVPMAYGAINMLVVGAAVFAVRQSSAGHWTSNRIMAHAISGVGAAVVITQAGLVTSTGRVEPELVGFGIAAGLVGWGIGSGVRPWLLAVLPVLTLWAVFPTTTQYDALLLVVALTASTVGPLERWGLRRLQPAQASLNTTS